MKSYRPSRNSSSLFLALAGCAALGVAVPALSTAQEKQGLAAKTAMEQLGKRFGNDRVEWIIEMRGYEGVPQPEEWEIVCYDPNARFLAREYWAGIGEETNEGPTNDFFPKRSPSGYIRLSDLKVDSRAAFTIAESEARKAKIGFDAVNYILRAREYSQEPIWTLELLDARNNVAGKIYISGETGEVLRLVWFSSGPDGPQIIDTSAPGQRGFSQAPPVDPEPAPSVTVPEIVEPSPRRTPVPEPPVTPSEPSSGGSGGRIPPPPIPPAP
ncbi:MAG: hypothetical protein KDM91_03680 [Verrucomicrobiae bacterium]|nr:hypothetical protein [Verrucomicrobiae bacterium]MCP5539435.1 hypothetical protein [Akkermansiaceae bacterium]MCP5551109.1 hypothetical protein [Akkermansiaceae bacterium]